MAGKSGHGLLGAASFKFFSLEALEGFEISLRSAYWVHDLTSRVNCLGATNILGLLSLLKDSFIAFHHFGAHNIFSVPILTQYVMLRWFYVIIFLTNCMIFNGNGLTYAGSVWKQQPMKGMLAKCLISPPAPPVLSYWPLRIEMDLNQYWIFESSPLPITLLTIHTTFTQHSHRFSSWLREKKNFFSIQKAPSPTRELRGSHIWVNVRPGGQCTALRTLSHGPCSRALAVACSIVSLTLWLCVCPAVTEEWQERGGQPWQLIETVDGFHPNEVSTVIRWLLKAVC